MPSRDTLQRFLFEANAVRGELVHLDAAFKAVRDTHAYPEPVAGLLGQMLAAAALLSASIKAHDSLIVQVQAAGPLHMLVARCSSRRSLRGLARWQGEVQAGPLEEMCGPGRLTITIDPRQARERYQGMVSLAGPSLAHAIETYFAQSEQLPTRLWLACDGIRAAGMLLQSIPGPRRDADAWNRVTHLAATITEQELLDLAVQEVRHRLFHEEDVRVFEPERTTFGCTCSRETIEAVLRSLGRAEIEDILQKEGHIAVTCEFCNRSYAFDAVDAEALLLSRGSPKAPPLRH